MYIYAFIMLCYALMHNLQSSHVYLFSSSYIIIYVLIYYLVHICSHSYVPIDIYMSLVYLLL